MTTKEVIIENELGLGFVKNDLAKRFDVSLGEGLAFDLDGKIKVVSSGLPSLNITKKPLYEYRDLWAEENGAISAGAREWSYGNGAVGTIGMPFGASWEMIEIGVDIENFADGASASFEVIDYRNSSSLVLYEFGLNDTHGAGSKTYRTIDLTSSPLAIPANSVIGFETGTVSGAVSDGRLYARFRRQIGEYVSDVTLESA